MRRIFVRIGEDVQVVGTSTADVSGMFLAPYQQMDLGVGAGINASAPRFVAITADLPANPMAVISTRGTHNIKNPQPDDPGGFTVFELFEA